MAAEVRRETRLGAEGDEEGDGGDGVQDQVMVARCVLLVVGTHAK